MTDEWDWDDLNPEHVSKVTEFLLRSNVTNYNCERTVPRFLLAVFFSSVFRFVFPVPVFPEKCLLDLYRFNEYKFQKFQNVCKLNICS